MGVRRGVDIPTLSNLIVMKPQQTKPDGPIIDDLARINVYDLELGIFCHCIDVVLLEIQLLI